MLLRSVSLFVLAPVAISVSAFGMEPSAEQVVAELKSSFERALNIEFGGKSSTSAEGGRFKALTEVAVSHFRITSSTDYWRLSFRAVSRRPVDGRLVSESNGFDYALSDEGALFCEWIDERADTVRIEESSKLEKSFALGYLGVVSLVFGYVDGNEERFLPAMLQGASMETTANPGLVLLRMDNEYGVWEVQVSTSTWLPTYMSIKLDQDDYFGSKRIRDYPVSGNSDQIYPAERLLRVVRTASFSTRSLSDGRSFIVGIESEQRMGYENDIEFLVRETVAINEINDAALGKEAFRFQTFDIPDGTPVQLVDAPQLPYVWRSGQFVSGVPDVKSPVLPFRQGRSNRWALITLNVAVIAILGGLVWWRQRQRRTAAR